MIDFVVGVFILFCIGVFVGWFVVVLVFGVNGIVFFEIWVILKGCVDFV